MTTWIPVLVAIVSAVLAGRYARQSRTAELQAQRLIELERRVAASKGEVFEPLVAAMGKMWDRVAKGDPVPDDWAAKHVVPAFTQFGLWVQIYGSDESVRVYHRYMQAVFHDAPPNVAMRLLAELLLSARRELGNPQSTLNAVDLMGIRINDIYSDGLAAAWARLPEAEVYRLEGWSPPWPSSAETAARVG